jgi:hypothetical protein
LSLLRIRGFHQLGQLVVKLKRINASRKLVVSISLLVVAAITTIISAVIVSARSARYKFLGHHAPPLGH